MPKVSFYLRNEDLDAWKSIEKKTAWIHDRLNSPDTHVVKYNKKLFVMNGVDPIKTYDATTEKQAPVEALMIDKHLGKVDFNPKTFDFCKHDAVKGMCKKGCK